MKVKEFFEKLKSDYNVYTGEWSYDIDKLLEESMQEWFDNNKDIEIISVNYANVIVGTKGDFTQSSALVVYKEKDVVEN